MKIVYLHQYYISPDSPSGGGTRSYEFARRLAAAGHSVDVVTSDGGEVSREGWQVEEEAGFRVHRLSVPYDNRMSYAQRIRSFLRFAMGSAGRAASLGADVVFATSTPLTICLPAIYAARRSHAPMVFEVRDLWPEVPIALGALGNPAAQVAARWLERFAYANAAEVVALSPGMAEGVRRAGVPEDRVHVIPNGSDLDFFGPNPDRASRFRSEHGWLGDRPLVVYTGTFGLVNGVGYLVDVAAEVAKLDPEIRFLLVGDGREAETVRARARERGVLDRSLFIWGSRPKLEIASVLAAADLATSVVIDVEALWHNSANKFFDGLASATAFAVNHEGWQADLIREWDAGLVLNARDTATAAREIVAALRTPDWAHRTGANARRLAESRFSRDDLAEQLMAVLHAAYTRRRAAGTGP